MRLKQLLYIIAIIMVFAVTAPGQASAHASLIASTPTSGASLKNAPEKIELTFNERIGSDGFSMHVYDSKGQPVSISQPTLGKKHQKLTAEVPGLEDGLYTVSYKVISNDGHPVASSFTFSVGDVAPGQEAADTSAKAGGNWIFQAFFYALRIFYYLSLIFTSGWIAARLLMRGRRPDNKQAYHTASQIMKTVFAGAAAAFWLLEIDTLLTGLKSSEWLPFLFSSVTGISWFVTLFLALISFWAVGKNRWIDGLWVLLLLGTEAVRGHSFTYQPVFYNLSLDFIHLAAASLWAGGLCFMVWIWRKDKDYVQMFVPRFSQAALICLGLLVITGTLQTFSYLPSISMIIHSLWGGLLIAKVVVVIGVVITGAAIRRHLKKEGTKNLIYAVRFDLVLAVAIIGLTAIFTYLSPLPGNEPVKWTETKNGLDIKAVIAPKRPGARNSLDLRIRTGEKPNEAVLLLEPQGNKDIAPIEIKLKPTASKSTSFYYKSDVPIPFPGKWQAVLHVFDSEDDETTFHTEFYVYPTE